MTHVGDPPPDLRALGRAVRRFRGALGLSQEAFADAAGLDRTYISGIERGVRNPTFMVLRQVAAGLRLSLSQLLAAAEAEAAADRASRAR